MLTLRNPIRINSTFVLQALFDAFYTLLLIETGHCRHQVNQHVVDHTHDGGIDSIPLDGLVGRGQIGHY
ncbi:hypothetical protein D3C80_2041890 [compost metagenome]